MKNSNIIERKYCRAQTILSGWTTKSIAPNATVFPNWIEGVDFFWYEREFVDGKQYRLVDARRKTNDVAFDHEALADALSEMVKESVSANDLPIKNIEITFNPKSIRFRAFGQYWVFDPSSRKCSKIDPPLDYLISPDGRYGAFRRDSDVWIKILASGEEYALTEDGESNLIYGANAYRAHDTGLDAVWSPDSARLMTFKLDMRRVKTLPVVHHVPADGSLRPTIDLVKTPYHSDEDIKEYRIVAIDVEAVVVQEADYVQIPAARHLRSFYSSDFSWWGSDSRRAYFIHMDRYFKKVRVVEFDTHTGMTRTLFEETSDTPIDLCLNQDDAPSLMPLTATSELIWYSQRSGWAHLYLYDLNSGVLKNTITHGDWIVTGILHFDACRREVLIQTAGRIPDRDPYYRDLVVVNIDTGKLTEIISSDHHYFVSSAKDAISHGAKHFFGRDVGQGPSPCGNFIVVTKSRADQPSSSLLLDRTGKQILELELTDTSALPKGWQWPEPVKLLGADGETDIYGLVYRPSDFSPENSYPIISDIFSATESPWVPKGSFHAGTYYFGLPYYSAASLAELGFIVVQIDGRGTPLREKKFTDEGYGWFEASNNLADHVAGIQQLAERYPYMDIDRVGAYAASGGFGAVHAAFSYPDFYKVSVQALCYDGRLMTNIWGDKHEGPALSSPHHQYPEARAANLSGKLLLMHGMLDQNCPPAVLFRLVEALQAANKDFDMLLLPRLGHGFSNYLLRRGWDYLVRNLLDVEPPKEFELSTPSGC